MSALTRLRRIFGRSAATQSLAAVTSSATVNGDEMRALLALVDAAQAWRAQRVQDLTCALGSESDAVDSESPEIRLARLKRTSASARAIETALAALEKLP